MASSKKVLVQKSSSNFKKFNYSNNDGSVTLNFSLNTDDTKEFTAFRNILITALEDVEAELKEMQN